MLSYKVAYRREMGTFVAEVPEFPEACAFGASLSDARAMLVAALTSAAERTLRRGGDLPIPDPYRTASNAYMLETMTVMPVDGDRVEIRVESVSN